jgi:hypothetical protein
MRKATTSGGIPYQTPSSPYLRSMDSFGVASGTTTTRCTLSIDLSSSRLGRKKLATNSLPRRVLKCCSAQRTGCLNACCLPSLARPGSCGPGPGPCSAGAAISAGSGNGDLRGCRRPCRGQCDRVGRSVVFCCRARIGHPARPAHLQTTRSACPVRPARGRG